MLVQHPARPAPAIVIVKKSGERLRFPQSAIQENTARNQYRSSLLRRGKAELAPSPHALGRALLEAAEGSLSHELEVVARQQRWRCGPPAASVGAGGCSRGERAG